MLTARIGPTGLVQELRTDNNVASTVVELRWPLVDRQAIPMLGSCVGEGCAAALPAMQRAPRRVGKATARRLARAALQQTIGRVPRRARLSCSGSSALSRALCGVRVLRGRLVFTGKVWLWYVVEGTGTRWYFTEDLVRRTRHCGRPDGCPLRIHRDNRLGGRVGRGHPT